MFGGRDIFIKYYLLTKSIPKVIFYTENSDLEVKAIMSFYYRDSGLTWSQQHLQAQRTFDRIPPSVELTTLTGSSSVWDIAFSTDGKYLASGSRDNTVKVYRTDSFQETKTLTGHSSDVLSISFSPNGKYLASGSEDKTIKVYQTEGFDEIKTLTVASSVWTIAFSPDDKYLVSGSRDNTVKVYRTEGFQEISTILTGHSYGVSSVLFSPNGRYLASGSGDSTVKIYQMDSLLQETVKKTYGMSSILHKIERFLDEMFVWICPLSALLNPFMSQLFRRKGIEIATLTGHSDCVNSVAFSPDNKYLASGSIDNTVKVYRTDNFQEIKTLTEHSNSVNSVVFSPDGKYLASGSDDKTVKIWGKGGISRLEEELSAGEKDRNCASID